MFGHTCPSLYLSLHIQRYQPYAFWRKDNLEDLSIRNRWNLICSTGWSSLQTLGWSQRWRVHEIRCLLLKFAYGFVLSLCLFLLLRFSIQCWRCSHRTISFRLFSQILLRNCWKILLICFASPGTLVTTSCKDANNIWYWSLSLALSSDFVYTVEVWRRIQHAKVKKSSFFIGNSHHLHHPVYELSDNFARSLKNDGDVSRVLSSFCRLSNLLPT